MLKTGSYLCAILTLLCSFASSLEVTTHGSTAKQNSMHIDPKMRAYDYKEAFELLRKEKAPSKVCVKLIDGTSISSIIEMNLMGNSTVFLLKYNSAQGIKFQAVELEMIQGVGYLE